MEIASAVNNPLDNKQGIGLYRTWFREAVDNSRKWQDEAREDYDFYEGRQWTKAEIQRFADTGRPAIIINRIKPLLNLLSGYQRLNRYDIDFVGRTPDDVEIAQVRKGITKYIMDRCDYGSEESAVFLDATICGLGWFFVGYEYDESGENGDAFIRREDPFGIYVDPEARRADFSDAKYIFRAKWVDKDELKAIYPEHAFEIDAQYSVYDNEEYEVKPNIDEVLWYKRELQKIRLVECWYKKREKRTYYILATGEEITADELTPEIVFNGLIVGLRETNEPVVKVCVFFDTVMLEEMDSPYEHGEFPLLPLTCTYLGVGGDEIPAGVVRDLKNPQREINRRRTQQLHILNSLGNGGGWIEEGAMDEKQLAEFERKGNIPGHFQTIKMGGLSKIQERAVGQYPTGVVQAEAQATQDLSAISGINEALMGVNIPRESSGKAIELKQKQALTSVATVFDKLRAVKKKIAELLWGRPKRAGVIPQFYTAEKVYRIEGVNGQQFVKVNEQVIDYDPLGNAIYKTMNDLSQGDFDIVIADVEASVTQRSVQMYALIETVSRLGIPADMIFDIILDLSDIPGKEEIKKRWAQRQESQAKAAQEEMQMKLQIEEIRNRNMHQSISFKDAPLPIQLAMAANQGLIDQQFAQAVINQWLQVMFPQIATQQQETQTMQEMQPQMQQTPEQLDKMLALSQMLNEQPQPNQGNVMTQPAMESLMRGMTAAI